jgi:hypothetical protein
MFAGMAIVVGECEEDDRKLEMFAGLVGGIVEFFEEPAVGEDGSSVDAFTGLGKVMDMFVDESAVVGDADTSEMFAGLG